MQTLCSTIDMKGRDGLKNLYGYDCMGLIDQLAQLLLKVADIIAKSIS